MKSKWWSVVILLGAVELAGLTGCGGTPELPKSADGTLSDDPMAPQNDPAATEKAPNK